MTRDDAGERVWDGIHMAGPYSWRPPSYWFSGRYAATHGATAEQGDNEHIPPFTSLKKFIPADKLWPINDAWFFHAGLNTKKAALTSIRRAVDRRYGASDDAEEFARKAQVAHYEATRAQFEAFSANGWNDHKMTIYWMLNSHWPSFLGHLFDYYPRPGGAYFGAKRACGRCPSSSTPMRRAITTMPTSPWSIRPRATCRAGCATTVGPTTSTWRPGERRKR